MGLLVLACSCVTATKYKDDEKVTLYANKVGPFANPSETYHYYNLPFCQPEGDLEHRTHGLGELLAGDRNVKTPYLVEFKKNTVNKKLCTKTLAPKDIELLVDATEDEYYFEMFLDELPM